MSRKDILLKLINERFGGSQAEFARSIKRSPAQVYQWLSGYRIIGDAGARNIEISLKLPLGYLDQKPSLVKESRSKTDYISYDWFDIARPIKQSDAETIEWDVQEPRQLALRKDFLISKQINAINCKMIYMQGHAMSPLLQDGDTLLIDTSKLSIIDGEIYAILLNTQLYIRKIERLDSKILLKPANINHEKIILKNDELQNFIILGQIIWRAG